MKVILLIICLGMIISIFIVLSNCLHKRNITVTLDQVKWKWGSFSDLKKTPVSVVVTNAQPDLDFTKAGYKEDFSEEAVRIVEIFKSAKRLIPYSEEYYRLPCSGPREQIWISFSDGTGRVFPFIYGWTSTIESKHTMRYSREATLLIEQVHEHNAQRRYPQEIHWNQIPWKWGAFSDLEKEVVGVMITDFEQDLNFDNVLYRWDFSDESLRVGYYLRTAPVLSMTSVLKSMIKWQRMWLVFSDGTGQVFPYFFDYTREYQSQPGYKDCPGTFFVQSGDTVKVPENISVAFIWKHAWGPVRDIPSVNMWKVTWKEGVASDLEKLPYHAYMTDSDPNYQYETKKTKGRFDVCDWVEITELIKRADKVDSYPDLQDRLRIIFEDGTGSVFPFFYDSEKKVCYVKTGEIVKCSTGLAKRVNPEHYNPEKEYVIHKPSTDWDTRIPRKKLNSPPQ